MTNLPEPNHRFYVKKTFAVLSVVGLASCLSSCVYPVPSYAGGPGYDSGPGYDDGGAVYEPGYVVAYGEPLYVYGGLNYYYYGGRYGYLDHGNMVYVDHVPHGASHYHGPHYTDGHGYKNVHYNSHNGGTNKTQSFNKTTYNKGGKKSTYNKGQQAEATQSSGPQPGKEFEK